MFVDEKVVLLRDLIGGAAVPACMLTAGDRGGGDSVDVDSFLHNLLRRHNFNIAAAANAYFSSHEQASASPPAGGSGEHDTNTTATASSSSSSESNDREPVPEMSVQVQVSQSHHCQAGTKQPKDLCEIVSLRSRPSPSSSNTSGDGSSWPKVLGSRFVKGLVTCPGRDFAWKEEVRLTCSSSSSLKRKLASGKLANGGTVSFTSAAVASSTQLEGKLPLALATILVPLMAAGHVYVAAVSLSCEKRRCSRFEQVDLELTFRVSRSFFRIFEQHDNRDDDSRDRLADAAFQLLQYVANDATDIVLPEQPPSCPSEEKEVEVVVEEEEEEGVAPEVLAKLYDTGGDNQQTALTAAQLPAGDVLRGVVLRPYQQLALAWMRNREMMTAAEARRESEEILNELGNIGAPSPSSRHASAGGAQCDAHPLWEGRELDADDPTRATPFFVNCHTGVAQLASPDLPETVRGGILADAMGMGKTIMMLSLIAHDREAMESSSSSSSSEPTLVVAPMSLLVQWKQEVESKTRLSVCMYHSDDRIEDEWHLKRHAVVLTSYGTLSSELRKLKSRQPGGILHRIQWRRVVLDEAHIAKNGATETSRAVRKLQAQYRWCVTGTPIQNALSDVHALLRFLRFTPWCDPGWWNKFIRRPAEAAAVVGDDSALGGGGSADAERKRADALTRLRALLKPIVLRRTKESRGPDGELIVTLPKKEIHIVALEFSEAERDFYDALMNRSRAAFSGFVAAGTVQNSYMAIWHMLLRLRQACNHPFLALGRSTGTPRRAADPPGAKRRRGSGAEAVAAEEEEDVAPSFVQQLYAKFAEGGNENSRSSAFVDSVVSQLTGEGDALGTAECPVCLEAPPCVPMLTPCAHGPICKKCLLASLDLSPLCPVCQQPVGKADVILMQQPLEGGGGAGVLPEEPPALPLPRLDELADGQWCGSAKMDWLVERLGEIQACESGDKVVVFSQWTGCLDLVEIALKKADSPRARAVRHVRLDGSLGREAKASRLRAFNSDRKIRVLLASLKTGGVGLNLTVANICILIDPWWNPATEDQAMDRIHRIGQTRPVTVFRLVATETVEQQLLQLQSRKRDLASNVLSSGGNSASKLCLEDLQSLFFAN